MVYVITFINAKIYALKIYNLYCNHNTKKKYTSNMKYNTLFCFI